MLVSYRNNGGGHLNHSFFWQILTNPSNTAGPSGELKGAIDSAFGSLDELKSKFNAAAAGRFGSGWAWVVIKSDGKLAVTSTPNQDNPLVRQRLATVLTTVLRYQQLHSLFVEHRCMCC